MMKFIPKREYYKYRQRDGSLIEIRYINFLNRKWFKKNKVIEGPGRYR